MLKSITLTIEINYSGSGRRKEPVFLVYSGSLAEAYIVLT
jgi:hypothetical protein